jgi:hypothetical protein
MAASAMKVAGDDHDSPGWWWSDIDGVDVRCKWGVPPAMGDDGLLEVVGTEGTHGVLVVVVRRQGKDGDECGGDQWWAARWLDPCRGADRKIEGRRWLPVFLRLEPVFKENRVYEIYTSGPRCLINLSVVI